jgi:ubiquinone/menaquinone biosynthesis C-methylase UbiE
LVFQYYNERAEEYEEFYRGVGAASIKDPMAYQHDVDKISTILPDHISGNVIDIACGTGFWMPVYYQKCTKITLVDQSEKMLRQCFLKAERLQIKDKIKIIKDNFFTYPFLQSEYDSALIGHFLSYVQLNDVKRFFSILRNLLKPGGKFIFIDSMWTPERELYRNRDGYQRRRLNDGTPFEIYRRYLTDKDFDMMAYENRMSIDLILKGRVFITVVGKFI